jgi:outer membrane protein insertion porin family
MATAGRSADRGGGLTRKVVRPLAPGFALACLLATAAALTMIGPPAAWAAKDGLPEGIVSEVRIEGNVGVTNEKIRAKLLCKPGGPLDARLIDTDIKSLMGTRWFSDVQAYREPDKKDPSKNSYILIFVVKEMPVLTHVEFRGRTKVKLKEIEENTSLKVGNRADSTRTHLAVGQIKRLYEEKGYEHAEVTLIEGGNLGDTRVVISIFEGPKSYVSSIDFQGNVFATDGTLRTKITSKTQILGVFGGKYHRDNLEEDARKLKEYYQSQGFFEVAVTPVTRSGASLGEQNITYVVSEGVRYKVRKIDFEGNKKIATAKLREGLALHSGQPILDSVKEADRKNLIAKYNQIGCIDTEILPDPKYTDEPGVVDIVYRINEGEPYTFGELKILGNERTKDKVLRREFAMAGLLPGEPLDANRIEIAKKRLGNLGYFLHAPDQGKQIDIRVTNRRPYDKPYGDLPTATSDLNGVSLTRMQGPDAGPDQAVEVPRVAQAAPMPAPAGAPPGGIVSPFAGSGNDLFTPPPDTPPITVPIPEALPGAPPAIAPRRRAPATPPIGAGEPPGTIPSMPGLNANDVGPDRQDPFPNRRAWADIITSVEEAPTGRFMLGVGASSFQGLTGNLTVSERNFDLFNPPRSLNDLVSGNAFRGGGQQFQLSLMPGNLINSFQMSLKEPYLFDLPIGASGAGYLFNRIYPNWTEARGGGRFSLGKQFGTQIYADVATRIEDVNFYGYKSPAPADYLAASGHTTLATIRPSLRFDNRNAPFMPNKGQYLELSFEQGFGTFFYPKAEVEGRTYFTLGSRPDGSGKRLLTFRGHFGATGRDTPVYERFFAGNFGSLRGFQYRGVGPRELGVNVGGIMEALGSVEYQFPWTANDMFHQVVFCDFGTVESDYRFSDIRVSVGTGLRMLIPAFGPMPLCFDLAFPVEKAAGDRVQYFNFTIGAYYN